MRNRRWWLFSLLFVAWLWLGGAVCPASTGHGGGEPAKEGLTRLNIFGRILNPHQKGVADVEIEILVDGKPYELPSHGHEAEEGLTTEFDGSFQVELDLPEETITGGEIKLKLYKPSYRETVLTLDADDFAVKDGEYYAKVEIIIPRTRGPAFWIATVIFVLAYVLISFELLHRTVAAMLGASFMLLISYTIGSFDPAYHIMSYKSAIHSIDMNVIFLLMGMMIIVGILKNTGIFQWCAYKCYQFARGNVIILSFILMIFTAVASAFLDNVTTMLLLTPVTIEIALSLGINPLSLLIPEILASNIGGTATLIGDPPNIMIGSYAGLTFMDFVKNLAPVCLIAIAVLFVYTTLIYKGEYHRAKVEDIEAFIQKLREEYRITDANLLSFGLAVMAVVILMFLLHGVLHMEVSIAALFGASVLFTYALVTKKVDLLHLIEKDIEWPTLLFFIFLFVLVGAVESVGLLDMIADAVFHLSKGSLVVAICLILWVAAIMSAFVDNIPFTATMLPITAYLTQVIPGAESGVLWWALALGACFGGNGTMIGASANVVTLGIAESAGHRVTFFGFMKVAFPYMVISVAICNVWLLIFY